MDDADTHVEPREWFGDAFNRKPLADYLTNSICAHVEREGNSVTVALDADWGAGKTFFCRAWIEDLRAAGYPVVYFDAWENDSGDEPAVALMATILSGLEEWERKLPVGKAASNRAKALTRDAVKSLRSALLPAAGVMAKGVVKKVTGVAVDDLVQALGGGPEQDVQVESEAIIGEALDRVFSRALAEQRERSSSLTAFRSRLQEKIQILARDAGARLPYFVFIDELDRCRPSYAVKLLEEVKHIFGISGVAYVVSTNIDQLQNSIRAEYGSDFDGRRYLRRMFGKEYLLPMPSHDDMLRFAVSKLDFVDQASVLTGLPARKMTSATAWALVSKSMFPADVRTQLQALDLLREVVDVIGKSGQVHILWLSYLVALYVVDSKSLARIANGTLSPAEDKQFVAATMRGESVITYPDPDSPRFERQPALKKVALVDVIAAYLKYLRLETRELFDLAYGGNHLSYPDSIAVEIAQHAQSMSNQGLATSNPLSSYPSIVLLAGRVAG